jgi:hypothetical protein
VNRQDVEAARAEAVRFIARVDALLAENGKRWDHDARRYVDVKKPPLHLVSGKFTGAVKRSSLDLTRALAHMRRRQ